MSAQTAQEQDKSATPNPAEMAFMAMRKLATDMTFSKIAVYELKRAVVWVPVAAGAALGVLWANKRWFT